MARTPSPTTIRDLRFFWAFRIPALIDFMRRWGHGILAAIATTSVIAMHMVGLPWLYAAWETASMFTLNTNPADLDTTWAIHHDGPMPLGLQAVLWSTRIAGPLILGGALLDALAGIAPPPHSVPENLRGHLVVIGAGRLGAWLAPALRERGSLVVVVDRSDDTQTSALRAAAFPVLRGDATHADTLLRAGVSRAAAVYVVTGHDEVNEQIALLALALQQPDDDHLRLVVHSSRPARCGDLLRTWAPPRLAARTDTFDTYAEVAADVVATVDPGAWDRIVIGGYGRFGRAVHAELLRVGVPAGDHLVVVDRAPGLSGPDQRVAHLLDAETFDLVTEGVRTLMFVCTDCDSHNLVFAHRAASLAGDHARVVTRTWAGPVVLPGLDPHGPVTLFSFVDILHRRLADDLRRWSA